MSDIAKRYLRNETFEIGGNRFESCRFECCTLIYKGGRDPWFSFCSFDRCTWIIAARLPARTLAYLNVLSGGELLEENSPSCAPVPEECYPAAS